MIRNDYQIDSNGFQDKKIKEHEIKVKMTDTITEYNGDTEETTHEDVETTTITIQTHDKRFHTDDVGAVSLLTTYYAQKKTEVQLIRSRNQELLKKADILIDVGGVYDPDTQRYDHHQDDCNEVFDDGFAIPLSSIGMVWKHFGKELLAMYIEVHPEFNALNNWYDHIDKIHTEVYLKSIQEIDAHDNGVPSIEGGKRNYWTHLSLGSIISALNTPDTNNENDQMIAFQNAVDLFGKIFEIKLEDIIRKYFDYTMSYDIVKKYMEEAPDNREYLIITDKVPTIYKCLGKLDPGCKTKFLIFHTPDESEITIRTRGRKDDIYTPIVPLLDHDKSCEYLGEDRKNDLIFVHKALFIAKTKTIETAIKLVGYALQNRPTVPNHVPPSYFRLPSFKRSPMEWVVGGLIVTIGLVGVGGLYLLRNNEE